MQDVLFINDRADKKKKKKPEIYVLTKKMDKEKIPKHQTFWIDEA